MTGETNNCLPTEKHCPVVINRAFDHLSVRY